LFWSNAALHGTFELDLDKHLDYDRVAADPLSASAASVVPRPG
jgi:hypothetical protein